MSATASWRSSTAAISPMRRSRTPAATRSSAGSWAPRATARALPTTGSIDMATRALIANQGIARTVERYGIIIVVIAMMVALYALQPEYFLSLQNLTNILKQIAMNALLAIGMFLVILTAGIDLSVGSVLALAMMALAMTDVAGVAWPIAVLVGPAVGLACGIINGLGLTLLRLPHPFIMTLG